jgi:PHP family Zn ribbon phosphoesterase
VYPQDPECVCGHAGALHGFGRRGGQTVRTACSASTCDCSRYATNPVPPVEHRCPTCGAHWNAIEAARIQ